MLDFLFDFLNHGLTHASTLTKVIYFFVVTQLTIFSVTLYLHRSQAHRGVDFHPVIAHFFRFWSWVSTGMITKEWVAIHRKHHAKCETEEDPHSPKVYGINKVLLQGVDLYRIESTKPETMEKYGKGTPDDWLERHLYSPYAYAGIALFVVAHLILFGIPGIIMIAVHLAAMPFFAAGVINGMGHAVGYRSFEMPSRATNLVPWALLLGGEELHNNHHAFPRSARFAVQPWEIDIGWLWIRLFRALGLARVRWVAPRPRLERRRREVDAETVSALFINRMHVLRDYGRRVVLPVCRELAAREGQGALPPSAPTLLIRHPAVLADEARRKLRELLEKHEVLRRVVEYRESLQQLWNESPARALAPLRDWCRAADESRRHRRPGERRR